MFNQFYLYIFVCCCAICAFSSFAFLSGYICTHSMPFCFILFISSSHKYILLKMYLMRNWVKVMIILSCQWYDRELCDDNLNELRIYWDDKKNDLWPFPMFVLMTDFECVCFASIPTRKISDKKHIIAWIRNNNKKQIEIPMRVINCCYVPQRVYTKLK